jgi:hypothetical protein
LAIFFQSSESNNNNNSNLIKKAIIFALEKLGSEQARLFIKKIVKEKLYDELKNKNKKFSEIQLKV